MIIFLILLSRSMFVYIPNLEHRSKLAVYLRYSLSFILLFYCIDSFVYFTLIVTIWRGLKRFIFSYFIVLILFRKPCNTNKVLFTIINCEINSKP